MAIQVLSAPVSSFVAPQTQPQSMQKGSPRAQQPAFNLHGDSFESSAQKAPQNANVPSPFADRSFEFAELHDFIKLIVAIRIAQPIQAAPRCAIGPPRIDFVVDTHI